MRTLSLFALVSCLLLASALAEPVIFLVRHAERATISGRVPSDTGLSEAGRARAESLARALRDAQITAIYTSEYKRTQETAAPLAKLLGLRSEIVPADDLKGLVAKLKAQPGNALVVGHSNTLPQILNALGISTRVAVPESDYDNLFLIELGRPPHFTHLHYR